MNLTTGILPTWLKQALAIAGLLLALAGIPAVLAFVCTTPLLVLSGESAAIATGVVSFITVILTAGAGGIIFWHSTGSLQGKISNPLKLPPVWVLLSLFGLLCIIGLVTVEINEPIAGFLLPPVLVGLAFLPPLTALAWFFAGESTEITHRQGLVAFAGGTTAGAFFTLTIVGLVITILLALLYNFATLLFTQLETINFSQMNLFARTFGEMDYIYIFILITLMIPIAAELGKPLVVLPVLGRFSPQGAFVMGSMAGAGFAALSNMMIVGWGLTVWNGALAVLLLGGAINPVCTGLVTMGWYGILQQRTGAWVNWSIRLGTAIIIHAFWNGGSLLILTLGDLEYFGNLLWTATPVEILAAGLTLVLLIALALGTFQVGRIKVRQLATLPTTKPSGYLLPQVVAIWATACLAIIVPTGLVWLYFLNR